MNLADNLKKIRKENNLSQEDLADKLGVSRQSVSKWESKQAYPEMDKVLQLCKMFNLNIDDLLNQDINDVNNKKQVKNNINKYIDDFFNYITKTINMFSQMDFKSKLKCIFEQLVIGVLLFLILMILGSFLSYILENILSFMNHGKAYYIIFNIFESIYYIICFVFFLIVILHIFKVRYLDYYEISFTLDENEEKENKSEIKPLKDNYLEKEKKIVIRDPKHSEYKFINGLIRCFLFFIKLFLSFIALIICMLIIFLSAGFIISFLFVKTGLVFVGIIISIFSFILINYCFLKILYDFIFNHKSKITRLAVIFFTSLILIGVGIAFVAVGFTKFTVIDKDNNNYFITSEKIIDMNDNLVIHGFNINYIESDNSNLKVVIRHTKFSDVLIEQNDDLYYFYGTDRNANFNDVTKDIIKNVNDKVIVPYGRYYIDIYTTKENINKLENNLSKYYQRKDNENFQNEISSYENKIKNLEDELSIKEEQIESLKEQIEELTDED